MRPCGRLGSEDGTCEAVGISGGRSGIPEISVESDGPWVAPKKTPECAARALGIPFALSPLLLHFRSLFIFRTEAF